MDDFLVVVDDDLDLTSSWCANVAAIVASVFALVCAASYHMKRMSDWVATAA
jgi:hypothetical protein